MNKSMQAFLISLEFIAVLLFAVPTIGAFCSILVGIIPIAIALYGAKDKVAGSKTLQPYIILGAVAAVRLVMDLLFYIIITMSGDANAQMAYLIIQVILLVVLVVLEIVALVYICLKKDVPVVGPWANKIAGVTEGEQTQTKKQPASKQNQDEENQE